MGSLHYAICTIIQYSVQILLALKYISYMLHKAFVHKSALISTSQWHFKKGLGLV